MSESLKNKETQPPDIKELFEVYGPLCNSEGFYQHTGQCWSDTLQMLFLYTDGLKEITQPLFALHTFTYVDIAKQFSSFVSDTLLTAGIGVEEILMEQNLKAIFEYFKAVQERFRRHYRAEVLRIKEFGPQQCYTYEFLGKSSLAQLKQIARSMRSPNVGVQKSGIRSAIMGKATKNYLTANRETIGTSLASSYGTSGKDTKYYAGGYTLIDIPYIISLYNELGNLQISYRAIPSSSLHTFKISPQTLCFYISVFRNTKDAGHAVGFFPCGKKEYYYDDNYGVISCPYTQIINTLNTSASMKRNLIFGGTFTIMRISPTIERIFVMESYPVIEEETDDAFYYTTFIETLDSTFKEIKIKLFKRSNSGNVRIRTEVFIHETIEYRFVVNVKEKQYQLDQILEIYKSSSGVSGVASKFNTLTGTYVGSRILQPSSYLEEGLLHLDRKKILNAIKNKKEPITFQTPGKATILHYAVGMRDLELLDELLTIPESPIDVANKDGLTPLNLAASINYTKGVLLLLKRGANSLIPSNTIPEKNKQMLPIDYAFQNNNKALIYALLEKLMAAGPTLVQPYLNSIIALNDSELLRTVLSTKVDPNIPSNGEFPLEVAVRFRNVKNMELLFDAGAQLKLVDKTRDISLLESVIQNWKTNEIKEVIELLVKNGENPLRTLKRGYTYLMKAAVNPLAFDALLSNYPFDLTQKNMDGSTILMILAAASTYNMKTYRQLPIATMIEAILEKGVVDINAQDNQGNTALMIAADQASTEKVRVLCQYSADPQIKNKKKQTVYDLITAKYGKHDPETLQEIRAALEGCKKKKGGKSFKTRKQVQGKKRSTKKNIRF